MRTAEATQLATLHRDPLLVEDAFATHYSAVFRQVQRLMRDPDDSYDLTLTAWEKAQRAWDRRPSVAVEIKPWLFRIARNACVDELRRRQLVRWEPLEGTRRSDTGESIPVAPAALLSSGPHDAVPRAPALAHGVRRAGRRSRLTSFPLPCEVVVVPPYCRSSGGRVFRVLRSSEFVAPDRVRFSLKAQAIGPDTTGQDELEV